MIVTSWSTIEDALRPLKGPDSEYQTWADIWRTAWYIWTVHKQGILCVLQKDQPLTFIPFSNEKYDNTIGWPTKHKLRFILDQTEWPNHEAYYQEKNKKYNIQEGQGILADETLWWLNGHLLCNTSNKWSDRSLIQLKTILESIKWNYGPTAFFINRRDAPLFMKASKMTPHWPALGPEPEVPLFYGLDEKSPVLSFYGSSDHKDLLWPPPEHWSLNLNDWPSWPKKPQAIFRGSLTGRYSDIRNMRLQLIRKANWIGPEMIDAGLTAWTPRCRVESFLKNTFVVYNGPPSDVVFKRPLTTHEQAQYAIIVYVPGHSASMRLAWHYLSGSCVVHLKDPSCAAPMQWFDTLKHSEYMFEANKHYIETDIQGLETVLASLLSKDGLERAQKIGLSAQAIARRVFQNDFMRSYVHQALVRSSVSNQHQFHWPN